jgi:MFS family permease
MIGLGIIWPLVPVLAADLGAKGVQIGLVIACFNIARSLSNPVAGRLSDRLGRKPFSVSGLQFYALVSVLYAGVTSVAGLAGTRLVHGFASVMVAPVAMALIADVAPPSRMGFYMETISMVTMLGGESVPYWVAASRICSAYRLPFYTMGGLAIVTLLGVLLFLPRVAGRLGREHGMGSVMGLTDSAWSLGMIFSPIFSGFVLNIMGMESVFSWVVRLSCAIRC